MKKIKYYQTNNRKLRFNIPIVLVYKIYCDDKMIRSYRLNINMKLNKLINFLIINCFAFKYNIYDNRITKGFYVEVLEILHAKENMSNIFIIQNYLENKKIRYKISKRNVNNKINNKTELNNYC